MKHIKPLISVNPEGWEEHARKLLERKPEEGRNGGEGTAEFGLVDSGDFWKVSGVSYRNGIYTVDLSKTLLEQGASKTQDQWASYAESAMQGTGFYTPNFMLQHALFSVLHANRESSFRDEIEQARTFIDENAKARWLATLTRIKYNPQGTIDEVVHDYKTNSVFSLDEDFVGPDEWVEQTQNTKPYKALLGTDNKDGIVEVYSWLNGVKPYLFRVNSDPDSTIERVARFVADSSRAFLYCYRIPSYSNASLGVRAVRRQ